MGRWETREVYEHYLREIVARAKQVGREVKNDVFSAEETGDRPDLLAYEIGAFGSDYPSQRIATAGW